MVQNCDNLASLRLKLYAIGFILALGYFISFFVFAKNPSFLMPISFFSVGSGLCFALFFSSDENTVRRSRIGLVIFLMFFLLYLYLHCTNQWPFPQVEWLFYLTAAMKSLVFIKNSLYERKNYYWSQVGTLRTLLHCVSCVVTVLPRKDIYSTTFI
jgi:hypothetical protein